MNVTAFGPRPAVNAIGLATTFKSTTPVMTFTPPAISAVASPNELTSSSESSSSTNSAPSSPKNSEMSLRHPRKRRSAWEIERLYACEESSKCTKKYGSASALRTHVKKKHPERLESFDMRQSSPAKVTGKKSLASLKPLPLSKFRVTSIGSIHTYLNNNPNHNNQSQVPRTQPPHPVILKQQQQQPHKVFPNVISKDPLPEMTPFRSSFSLNKCNMSPSPPMPLNPASIEHVLCGTPSPPPAPPAPCNPLLNAFSLPLKNRSKDLASQPQDIFPFLSCELEGWKREAIPGKLELFTKLSVECETKERPDCLLVMMMTKEAGQPEGYLCMKINFSDITNLTVEYGVDVVRFHIDTQSLQLVVNSRGGRLDTINDFKSQHLPKLTPKTATSEDKKVTLRFERPVFAEYVPQLQKDQCLASKFHIARPITIASPPSSSSFSSYPLASPSCSSASFANQSEATASFSSNVVQSNNR